MVRIFACGKDTWTDSLSSLSVFISYRRSDSYADAGRLSDRLERKLGSGSVFPDTVSISGGDRFKEVIARYRSHLSG
jgi:hypothetical protein